MPVSRTMERHSHTLASSPPKTYTLTTQYEDADDSRVNIPDRMSQRRTSEMGRKSAVSSKASSSSSSLTVPSASLSRRTVNGEGSVTRGRSNTDVQSAIISFNGLKQQQSTLNGSGSDKSLLHSNSPPPSKPRCSLPPSNNQSGCVTPSKLFNMMGYGLENQYLFMHAHYLYIIDCRSREQFNDNHIITAIHWEDAMNGTVYISLVERFSEIVLYDDQGYSSNPTAEMSRIMGRFSPPGSRSCASLDGGFEAFRALFPFQCTQSNIRSAVDREKFLTIYPSVVLDNKLYLGTGHQATNWKVVRDLKLTHIVNISIEHQCVFVDKIKYLHLQLEDKEDVLLRDRFDETIRFMELALQNPNSRIMVHCNLGISRSTSLILAFLMKNYNATLLEAFKFLRHRRPIVCPNVGFLQQLIEFEYDLYSHNYSDPNDPIFH